MNNEQNTAESIAVDIYQRLDMAKAGDAGTVYTDLSDALETGDFEAFEDYFGDLDPFEFL